MQVVSVEIEDEIVDKVVSVADDDQRQLVGQLSLLQEVLHALRGVAVGFPERKEKYEFLFYNSWDSYIETGTPRKKT